MWAASPHRRGAARHLRDLMHFDGTAWVSAPADPTCCSVDRPITSIFGASPTDVWARPGCTGTAPDGRPCSRSGRLASSPFTAAPPTTSSAWVVTAASSTSTATTWEDWDATLTDDGIVDVWGAANGELFAVTATMVLHHDGRGWSRAFHGPGASFVAVWGYEPDNVVFLRQDGEQLIWDGALPVSPIRRPTRSRRDIRRPTCGRPVPATSGSRRLAASARATVASSVPSRSAQPWLQVLSTPGSLEQIAGSGPTTSGWWERTRPSSTSTARRGPRSLSPAPFTAPCGSTAPPMSG